MVDRFLRLNLGVFNCRTSRVLLAIFWITGLLLGTLTSLLADDLLFSTMRMALCGGMSILGLLVALLLPLLITAFAVYISQPLLFLPLSFLKAFLFSFVGAGLLTAFGSSAWLLRILLMFADSLTLPLLWWVWLRVLSDEYSSPMRSTLVAAAFVALIGCFDYVYVAPFLALLI